MNLIDYMQMGIYGAVTLEYFPETERLQVSWFPAGRPRANFVCGVKVINETVLEFDKIKDEQGEVFNILPMALLGRRLRGEIRAVRSGHALNAKLLKELGRLMTKQEQAMQEM